MNAKETNIRRRLPTTTGDQNLPFCKYHIYSSLRTDLNFNGDNSLTFKRTLQVPQINVLFIHYKIAFAMFLLQIIQLKGNMEIL